MSNKLIALKNLYNLLCKYEVKDLEDLENRLKNVADLESKLAEHNEYFRSFSCENFNEFQDFISTFMLTPHEEQTLIRELKQQLAEWQDGTIICKWTDAENKVKELEQKLAEKEADIIAFDTDNYSFKQQIDNLREQLSEKEKEISFYQNALRPKPETVTEICELIRPYELKLRESEMYKDRFESLYNHYNQDKISFAVEQLEKVKARYPRGTTMWSSDRTEDGFEYVYDYINNQIAELKKGVE